MTVGYSEQLPYLAPVASRIRDAAVVAVLTVTDVEVAVPAARALVEGGVTAMELTLRTPVAIEALRLISGEVPEMLACAGTVLRPDQVNHVAANGAAFGVSPGFNPTVAQAAIDAGLPFAPGVATPSDIEAAVAMGFRLLKFFPAEPSGGLPYLKSMAAPYLHLGVEFFPLGGITLDALDSYLRWHPIAAVGGSWIAPPSLLEEHDFDRITANALEAATICREVRNA